MKTFYPIFLLTFLILISGILNTKALFAQSKSEPGLHQGNVKCDTAVILKAREQSPPQKVLNLPESGKKKMNIVRSDKKSLATEGSGIKTTQVKIPGKDRTGKPAMNTSKPPAPPENRRLNKDSQPLPEKK